MDRLKYRGYLAGMDEFDEHFDEQLDAIGLLCPLPVLKARKRLMSMAPGRVLKMLCDDPAAIVDVPHYCVESGHTLVGQSDEWGWKAVNPFWCYDLHATVLHLLGIDHERLTVRNNGIDRRLTDVHGKVIRDLLA